MKVLGLSGSLRAGSHNSKLLRAAGDLLPGEAELVEFDGLKLIPPFDEDDEHARPDAVQALFDAIASADAVLRLHPRVQPLDPGPAQERPRLALPPADRVARCATSRPPSSAPRTGLFGAVWAQAEARKVLAAIGARVIDRELPIGMADDAFARRRHPPRRGPLPRPSPASSPSSHAETRPLASTT